MEPTSSIPLLDSDAGSCGCGCGCGTGAAESAPDRNTLSTGTDLSTQTYSVAGLTCGHCERAVISEISAIDGVTAVSVDLVPEGLSSVTVSSTKAVDDVTIATALAEAGDYRLV